MKKYYNPKTKVVIFNLATGVLLTVSETKEGDPDKARLPQRLIKFLH